MSMPTNQSPGVTALSSYGVMSMVRTLLIAQNTLVMLTSDSRSFRNIVQTYCRETMIMLTMDHLYSL